MQVKMFGISKQVMSVSNNNIKVMESTPDNASLYTYTTRTVAGLQVPSQFHVILKYLVSELQAHTMTLLKYGGEVLGPRLNRSITNSDDSARDFRSDYDLVNSHS